MPNERRGIPVGTDRAGGTHFSPFLSKGVRKQKEILNKALVCLETGNMELPVLEAVAGGEGEGGVRTSKYATARFISPMQLSQAVRCTGTMWIYYLPGSPGE